MAAHIRTCISQADKDAFECLKAFEKAEDPYSSKCPQNNQAARQNICVVYVCVYVCVLNVYTCVNLSI